MAPIAELPQAGSNPNSKCPVMSGEREMPKKGPLDGVDPSNGACPFLKVLHERGTSRMEQFTLFFHHDTRHDYISTFFSQSQLVHFIFVTEDQLSLKLLSHNQNGSSYSPPKTEEPLAEGVQFQPDPYWAKVQREMDRAVEPEGGMTLGECFAGIFNGSILRQLCAGGTSAGPSPGVGGARSGGGTCGGGNSTTADSSQETKCCSGGGCGK
ncbi:unnamed protein product [Amoebophrya sp. A25]|nr:unnamed protein product [Amoebophrya sp. A25]|eukprot:GSA25T00007187001.1